MNQSQWRKRLTGVFTLLIMLSMALGIGPALAETADETWDLEYFSQDQPLEVLFESKEIKGFKEFMISRTSSYTAKIAAMTLIELGADGAWDPDGMEYGINHLLDIIHSGTQVAYDFYTEEQRAADEDLERTKLFYFPGEPGMPFVVLCAGGGFTAVCNMVEAFPVAAKLNELGYNVFCVSYRPAKPALEVDTDAALANALDDLAAAIRYIYMNATTFNISTDKYAIGGFSAGAFLAGEWSAAEIGYGNYGLPKPDCVFLVYGAGHMANYTENYPPAFFTYCLDDPVVSSESNALVVEKLEAAGVPVQVKVGETGGHGFGLGLGTDVEGWVEEAIAFWNENTGYGESAAVIDTTIVAEDTEATEEPGPPVYVIKKSTSVLYTLNASFEIEHAQYGTLSYTLLGEMFDDQTVVLTLSAYGSESELDKGVWNLEDNGYTVRFVFENAGEIYSDLNFETQEVTVHYILDDSETGMIDATLLLSVE